VLLVRRNVPESPRWLFIHGREREGDRIVTEIEERVCAEDGELPEPSGKISARQRRSISMALIARSVFTLYPRRTALCFALFIGQAFLYNAFFFTYGDTLTTLLGVKQTGWYIAIFAASNFLGAVLLSRLFDTVGRVRMIAGTYVLSGILLAITGVILGSLTGVAESRGSGDKHGLVVRVQRGGRCVVPAEGRRMRCGVHAHSDHFAAITKDCAKRVSPFALIVTVDQ
jgi:hypothetical protein